MFKFNHSLGVILLFISSLVTLPLAGASLGVSDAQAHGIAIQSDGSILIAGYVTLNNIMQVMTARYTSAGLIDTTYGNNGYFAFPVESAAQASGLVLLSNNNAVIGGYGSALAGVSFLLAQISSLGTLNGYVTSLVGNGSAASGIVIDSSGNYVMSGFALVNGTPVTVVVRYLSSGILDTSFGSGGIVTTQINDSSEGHAIALQTNGNIVVGSSSIATGSNVFAVSRYTTNGSLDTTFNSSGSQPGTVSTSVGFNAQVNAIAVQSNGSIVVAGTANSNFALARYNTDGSLDTTFGSGGIVGTVIGSTSQINGIGIDSNGQIVAVGTSDQFFAVARYNSLDGSLDTTFNGTGIVISQVGVASQAFALAFQSNGQILVAGTSDNGAAVARYNTNGSLDTTFGVDNGYTVFPVTSAIPDISGIVNINIANKAGIVYSKLNLTNSIINSDISTTAAIADTKLGTIQTPGKVLNSATTATNLNTAGALVTRDSLGNFSANSISSNLVGNVAGSASNNVLKAGDTMTGSLVLPAGSASNPSLQFSGSTNVGLSALLNTLTLSTDGAGAVTIDANGAVTIATPRFLEVGLTINGGGATIAGNVSNSENLTFNTSATALNAVGSTQGPLLKVYAGSGNTGLTGTVTILYPTAGFSTAPQIYLTSTNGSVNALGVNLVTSTSALVLSGSSLNVPFNYLAIGV